VATPRSSGAAVSVQVNEAGDYELGAKVQGVFVPFVTVAGHQIAGLVQNRKAHAAGEDEPDAEGEA